jgi:hypothetical protein
LTSATNRLATKVKTWKINNPGPLFDPQKSHAFFDLRLTVSRERGVLPGSHRGNPGDRLKCLTHTPYMRLSLFEAYKYQIVTELGCDSWSNRESKLMGWLATRGFEGVLNEVSHFQVQGLSVQPLGKECT